MSEPVKKAIKLLCFLACLVVLVNVAWSIAYPTGTWRYKMTVEINTPEGVKTGFAVREVGAHAEPRTPHSGGSANLTKGEAVVIDLGARGVVYALIKGYRFGADYGHYIVFETFPSPRGGVTPQGKLTEIRGETV